MLKNYSKRALTPAKLCVMMTMKNDSKFEKDSTCQFKIDMWNLTNFDSSTQKS